MGFKQLESLLGGIGHGEFIGFTGEGNFGKFAGNCRVIHNQDLQVFVGLVHEMGGKDLFIDQEARFPAPAASESGKLDGRTSGLDESGTTLFNGSTEVLPLIHLCKAATLRKVLEVILP